MNRFWSMIAIVAVCAGCQYLDKEIDKQPDNEVEIEPEVETELEVDKSNIAVDFKAQSVEIAVRTNRTFEVDVCVGWITCAIAECGDIVVLSVTENTTTEPRSAEVVIIAGELMRTITIEQGVKPELMELLLEHSSAHLDSPEWSGYDIKGSVDWGDGTTEEYSEGMSHDYADAQKRSVKFTMEGATSFRIERIGDIEGVTILL